MDSFDPNPRRTLLLQMRTLSAKKRRALVMGDAFAAGVAARDLRACEARLSGMVPTPSTSAIGRVETR